MRYLLILLTLLWSSRAGAQHHVPFPHAGRHHPHVHFRHTDQLLVSFLSVSAGIDTKSIPLMEQELNQFRESGRCHIRFEKHTWGREGERDYCIRGHSSCLSDLAQRLHELFKDNDRILIQEHTSCRH